MILALEGVAPAPRVLQEYILKKEFGWTQSELENEYVEDLQAYAKIISLIKQMKPNE